MSSRTCSLAVLFVGLVYAVYLTAAEVPVTDQRSAAVERFRAGDFNEAYQAYRRLALDPGNAPHHVGDDLRQAIGCLNRLGRTDEIDELRDAVVAAHAKQWRVLHAAAMTHRGGRTMVDRWRAGSSE